MTSDIVEDLRSAAMRTAGELDDFGLRANAYARLHRNSGSNHAFALLAGHGAMWAEAYIRNAMRAAAVLAVLRYVDPVKRHAFWMRMTTFANAFRSIHRQVYAEVMATWTLAGAPDLDAAAQSYLDPALLDLLRRAHHARRHDTILAPDERRALFDAMFAWEQERIVGNQVIQAFADLQCNVVQSVAKRPLVRFGYFPIGHLLVFSDFAQRPDRVRQGSKAYALGERVGWDKVDSVLRKASERSSARLDVERNCRVTAWLSTDPSLAP